MVNVMALREKEEVIELNILGQVCPACLLVVLKEINDRREDLRSGRARLVVRTDHRNATRTVPESARKMGYEVNVQKEGSYYQITVGRKA
jgi:TusA-related sulfurtransferase